MHVAARMCLRAVDAADVVIYVAGAETVGAWVEIGYALAKGKKVLRVGVPSQRSIFTALIPGVCI